MVLFYLNKAKLNKQGYCPIYCRITYLKKRKQFSSGQFVKPEHWQAKEQKVSQVGINGQYINTQLSVLIEKIRKAHLSVQLEKNHYTVDDIIQQYIGKPSKEKTLIIQYFKDYLKKLKKLVGIEIKNPTYKKSEQTCVHISDFIQWKFKKKDIFFESLNLQFLEDFDYYLKTEKKHKQITINKSIQLFKRMVKTALAEGIVSKDPFILYKAKRVKRDVIYLNDKELKKLEKHSFQQPRLEMVKDLFIFCCYTGLAYLEMSSLSKKHIIKNFDGRKWIKMNREKTSKIISIPLLKKAKEILKKYDGDKALLPSISNQKFNSYLKEIADIVGIDKRLTHHTARKTFATTVLLYNDVPMEIVSELLGHSNMNITQAHYGKIVQKKVSEEMRQLAKKLKN